MPESTTPLPGCLFDVISAVRVNDQVVRPSVHLDQLAGEVVAAGGALHGRARSIVQTDRMSGFRRQRLQ